MKTIISTLSFLAVIAGALLFSISGDGRNKPAPVMRASGWDLMWIDGNHTMRGVLFSHSEHIKRTGDGGCVICHHLDKPGEDHTPCSSCHRDMNASTSMFDHDLHAENYRKKERHCASCHTDRDRKKTVTPCSDCHQEFLHEPRYYYSVRSYKGAMHGKCIPCHELLLHDRRSTTPGNCNFCHNTR